MSLSSIKAYELFISPFAHSSDHDLIGINILHNTVAFCIDQHAGVACHNTFQTRSTMGFGRISGTA
jgi:hypothetical protein